MLSASFRAVIDCKGTWTKAEKHVQLCRFATRPLLTWKVRHPTYMVLVLVILFYSIQSAVVLLPSSEGEVQPGGWQHEASSSHLQRNVIARCCSVKRLSTDLFRFFAFVVYITNFLSLYDQFYDQTSNSTILQHAFTN